MSNDIASCIVLNEAAKRELNAFIEHEFSEYPVIMITPDADTGVPLARFMERSVLETLKARYLGDAIPGVGVYGFGLGEGMQHQIVELTMISVSNAMAINQVQAETMPETLLAVTIRNRSTEQRRLQVVNTHKI